MAEQVVMPKLGLTMEEGIILRWYRSPGDAVRKGDPLLEVEGDKATSDVQSPVEGTLLRILAEEGRTVPVGTPIALVGEAGEHLDIEPDTAAPMEAEAAGTTTPGTDVTGADVVPSEFGADPFPQVRSADEQSAAHGRGDRIPISPRARRLAEREGIDWTRIRGSDRATGRIQEKDVRAVLAARRRGAVEDPEAGKGAGRRKDAPLPDGARREPFGPRRAVIARRLQESALGAPHIHLWVDIDAEELLAFRKRYNSDHTGNPASLTDLFVKASALALGEHPRINAWVEDGGVVLHSSVHVGIAVGLDDGVVVPVLRNADTRPLADLSAESRRLVGQAGAGMFPPGDLEGGTFTVTNLGAAGIDRFTAIINPPQAAILAIGAVSERAAVRDGRVTARRMLTVCLGADHRAVDGIHAAAFLATLRRMLENPDLLTKG